MGARRAARFSLAAGLLFCGALLGGAIIFWNTSFGELSIHNLAWLKAERISLMAVPSMAVLLCLILPGCTMLGYLALTQESRLKPWILEQIRNRWGSGEGGM